MSGDFDMRQGRRKSVSASIEILLPMAAAVIGIVLRLTKILTAMRRSDGLPPTQHANPLLSVRAFRAEQRRRAKLRASIIRRAPGQARARSMTS
jgi:hypothetical protein